MVGSSDASANDSDRDGPGVLPNGSLVSLRRVSIRDGPSVMPSGSLVYRFGVMVGSSDASANDSNRDGPGVLPDGSLDNCLKGILISGLYAAATEFCFP